MATVDLFAAKGANVIATDINPIDGATGRSMLTLHHDVANEDDWIRVLAAAVSRFGHVDILVNNASISAARAVAITEVQLAEWHRILAINLDGTFLGMKHAMAAMADKGGSIINVSSIYGQVAAPNTAAYSSSKGGVAMVTKVGAVEGARLARPVRVNSVHPGFVETALVAGRFAQHPDRREQVLQATPLGRLATPTEVASAILYLACDEAAFVTGSALTIDGGYTAI